MFKKLLIVSLLLFSACSSPADTDDFSGGQADSGLSTDQSQVDTSTITPPQVSDDTSLTQPEMQKTPQKGDHIATINTSMGDIKVVLYADEVSETVKNFEELAKSGKYDKTIFHRVIKDFMIQGGDIENMGGYGGYSYKGKGTSFADDFKDNLKVVRGALCMANSGKNTNGSQFFIVQAKDGASWLNGKHTVFGFVYEGMDVVDKIAAVKVLMPGYKDKPETDIVLKGVTLDTFK